MFKSVFWLLNSKENNIIEKLLSLVFDSRVNLLSEDWNWIGFEWYFLNIYRHHYWVTLGNVIGMACTFLFPPPIPGPPLRVLCISTRESCSRPQGSQQLRKQNRTEQERQEADRTLTRRAQVMAGGESWGEKDFTSVNLTNMTQKGKRERLTTRILDALKLVSVSRIHA